MRAIDTSPSKTACFNNSPYPHSEGTIIISTPALIARTIPSFCVLTIWSRLRKFSISAQSVTTTPSQFNSCLSQPVSNRLLATPFIPFSIEELVITDKAPALRARRNGANCFSRKSISVTFPGLRSIPLPVTP